MTGSVDRAKEALKDLRARLQASTPTDDPERLPQLVDELAAIVQMLVEGAVPVDPRINQFVLQPNHRVDIVGEAATIYPSAEDDDDSDAPPLRDFPIAPGHSDTYGPTGFVPLEFDRHFNPADVRKYMDLPIGVMFTQYPGMEFAVTSLSCKDDYDWTVHFVQILRTQEAPVQS